LYINGVPWIPPHKNCCPPFAVDVVRNLEIVKAELPCSVLRAEAAESRLKSYGDFHELVTSQLQRLIDRLTAKQESLQAVLDTRDAEIAQLKERVQTLLDEATDRNLEIEHKDWHIAKLEEKITELEKRLEEEQADKRANFVGKADHQSLEESLKKKVSECRKFKERVSTLESGATESSKTIEFLKEQLGEMEVKIEALWEDNDKLRKVAVEYGHYPPQLDFGYYR